MKKTRLERRTNLRRRTPLKPGNKPLKRSRLARISDAERKRQRDNQPLLFAYRREHPDCQCGENCGCPGEHIHEIPAGSHRRKARTRRSCILHLFGKCHRRCQGEPYAKGLARKLAADPVGFDLAEFLRVIGRAPTAILIDEVIAAMPKKLKSADDLKLTLEHWERKVRQLDRLQDQAETERKAAQEEYDKALVREAKIAAARRTKY